MELWSTTMEWLLLMYQSTWNNHQSAQEPPKHLTSRKTKSEHFLKTFKGQHGYIPFFFHIFTRPNSSPVGVLYCRCSFTLPYTPPHMLSFMKYLNQNIEKHVHFFFFFREVVSCIHSDNEGKKPEAAAAARCCGFTASEIWQQRKCCALKLTARTLCLLWDVRTDFHDSHLGTHSDLLLVKSRFLTNNVVLCSSRPFQRPCQRTF